MRLFVSVGKGVKGTLPVYEETEEKPNGVGKRQFSKKTGKVGKKFA